MFVRVKGIGSQASLKRLLLGALLSWVPMVSPAAEAKFSGEQLAFYEKNIQPILSESCYKCHSHHADKIKGNLVLDSREGVLAGGEKGPAIVPGDPEASLLIKAVRRLDEDLQMPPKK